MTTADLDLRPGDLFVTKNPQALGRGINAIQTFWSRDGQSQYSHAGIILDPDGTTFEALWTIKRSNLFKGYVGEKVCIARWVHMIEAYTRKAMRVLSQEHEGKIYPAWRLFLNVIPPLAKYTSFKGRFAVCSELVAKFLYIVYQQHGYDDDYGYKWPRHSHYCGTNPDMLADEWHRWDNYEIVFEGVLK